MTDDRRVEESPTASLRRESSGISRRCAIVRITAAVIGVALALGPIRMGCGRLIPWWVFGSRAIEESIVVVGGHGRFLQFSNGVTVRDDAIALLGVLWAICSGLTLILLMAAAGSVCRRLATASDQRRH